MYILSLKYILPEDWLPNACDKGGEDIVDCIQLIFCDENCIHLELFGDIIIFEISSEYCRFLVNILHDVEEQLSPLMRYRWFAWYPAVWQYNL